MGWEGNSLPFVIDIVSAHPPLMNSSLMSFVDKWVPPGGLAWFSKSLAVWQLLQFTLRPSVLTQTVRQAHHADSE